MAYFETGSNKVDENSPLPDLVAAIRRLNQAISNYTRSALRTSLDLGDALAWARARVKVRRWKSWRQEHAPDISKRRDEVCRQLAASRPIIERELVDNPDLSIRDALKLITNKSQARPPKTAALEKWRALKAEEKRAGLAADGPEAFLEYMPPEWREVLADRVMRVKHRTSKDRGLSVRLREHIEKHPDGELAKYVQSQAIELKHLVVHVGAIDAPSKRRPALMDGQVHAHNNVKTTTNPRRRDRRSSETSIKVLHRRMKLGPEVVKSLQGTSLAAAAEQDELVMLNRGVAPGELTDVVRDLVASAVAGEKISAIAYTAGLTARKKPTGEKLIEAFDLASAAVH